MRLRYVGALPTTFVTLGVEVDPGGEFEVPDAAAPGLLARVDIEEVDAPKATRRKSAQADAPLPLAAAPTGGATGKEVPDGVSDDH